MRVTLLLAMLLALSGCSSLSYYTQAINGQLEISRKATPIDSLLADPGITPELERKLKLVQRARAFASAELGLPDNDSFRSYADLQRPFVVWNVFAAPAFSVKPVEWCFPVAGCVAYRGYFSEAAAQAAGAALRAEGRDVFVAGIPVYSTLGWFNDPVLNTFVDYPEGELVGILFHELAHQVVYVPGDSTFNESFATAVEEEGVRRWFAQSDKPTAYAAYLRAQQRKREFIALLVRTRDRLAAAYAQAAPADELGAAKARILHATEREYDALKHSWGGYSGYDRWFGDSPLNNAKLLAVTLYADQVPAFAGLLAQSGGDLPRFYAQVRGLARLPQAQRDARLAAAKAAYRVSAAGF